MLILEITAAFLLAILSWNALLFLFDIVFGT